MAYTDIKLNCQNLSFAWIKKTSIYTKLGCQESNSFQVENFRSKNWNSGVSDI